MEAQGTEKFRKMSELLICLSMSSLSVFLCDNKVARSYIYIYIYETCAWTPNNVFLSMIVVESLSCKLEWSLAQVFAISIPLTIVAVESEVYECQTKCAKAICVGLGKSMQV